MSVFLLDNSPLFPPGNLAGEDGLLAVGGDLSPDRLLHAYQNGIFPWYNPGEPILWWCPDPRLILEPEKLHVSRRLGRFLSKAPFKITFDTAFDEVIQSCAQVRLDNNEGTWLSNEMIRAYTTLHEMGYAHSAEAWENGTLAGGLYGLAIGRIFFGESMFYRTPNASKAAFIALVTQLRKWNFAMVDCQVVTRHLLSLGARTVSRHRFLSMLSLLTHQPSKAPPYLWHT